MKHDIYFDEKEHLYLVDGKEVPSVTEILKPLSQRGYAKVNESVLGYAAARGKAVHEALELIDLGADAEVSPEMVPYIRAYEEFKSIYKPQWELVEAIVYNEGYNYIGTLDRLGVLNDGLLSVVDLKTSNATKEALVSVCLQTRMYELAYLWEHKETFERILPRGTLKRYGLFLKPDGSFRLVDCEEYEKKYNIDPNRVIGELWSVRQTIDRLLATKEKQAKGEQK